MRAFILSRIDSQVCIVLYWHGLRETQRHRSDRAAHGTKPVRSRLIRRTRRTQKGFLVTACRIRSVPNRILAAWTKEAQLRNIIPVCKMSVFGLKQTCAAHKPMSALCQ